MTYCCHPKKDNRKCILLCLALLVSSVVIFFLATRTAAQFRAIGQMLSVILLLLFVQLSNKFLLTEYLYTLEDNMIFFTTRQGKRCKNLGSVSLTENTRFFTKEEWEKEKENITVKQIFSFCQNLSPKNPSYLLIFENGAYTFLAFEPDETLSALLRKAEKTVEP